MAKTAKNILPAYLTDIYGWLYLNPKLYNLLDNAFLLNFLTLGYHSLLTEEVKKEIPEVDAILGTNSYDSIWEAVEETLDDKFYENFHTLTGLPHVNTKRTITTGGHFAYLKIAEGCNKNCTYCIIPSMRGHYRSVPMEDLIEEAEKLAEKGIRELILVAQETTLYGVDLYHEKKLPELLRRLSEILDIEWIRVLYCYPEEITVELAQELRENPKVCHYLDLPIQHCNDEVLKRMGRRTTKAELIEKIKMLRKEIPDIALRTTLISGFPGETNEQHEECIEFVREMKFDRLGVFPYSEEEGTKAADYPEQIDMEIRRQWADEIMEAQQEVIFAQNETLVGKTYKAIVDGYLPQDNVYVARTYRDTPEIDGCIFFQVPYEIVSGTIVTLLVTDAKGYDLIGEICSEEDDE